MLKVNIREDIRIGRLGKAREREGELEGHRAGQSGNMPCAGWKVMGACLCAESARGSECAGGEVGEGWKGEGGAGEAEAKTEGKWKGEVEGW